MGIGGCCVTPTKLDMLKQWRVASQIGCYCAMTVVALVRARQRILRRGGLVLLA